MTEKDAAGDAVGAKLAPAGLGCITLIFGIGQAIGPAVAGYIKDSTGSFTGRLHSQWLFL